MANFSDYGVGTNFTVQGVNWKITNVNNRTSKAGRAVRVFTVTDENGRSIQRTSRGLTFWINGGGNDLDAAVEADADGEANTGLAAAIAEAVRPYMETAVDSDEVRQIMDERLNDEEVGKIVDKCLAARLPRQVEVVRLDGSTQNMGVQHTHFDALLRVVACRINAWLVGPAGTGKTSAGMAVANALGLDFYTTSVGPQTSKSDLIGYMDANGNLVRTQLRDAYEKGGVFVLDEVDAGSPAVLVTINALLANNRAGFPDKVVGKHPDFILVACANTIGQGADAMYVGRSQIDEATRDRFALMDWPIDAAIESAACGVPMECFAGLPVPTARKFHDGRKSDELCCEFVRKTTKIRMALLRMGRTVRMLVGNRSNIHGTRLIRAGWSVDDAMEVCVWRGCDRDTRTKVETNAR
jgi:hypothetical protein